MGAIETVGIVEELMEIWPNEVCDNSIKLELPSNHLLNELAKGVEQDNGLKDLRNIVN